MLFDFVYNFRLQTTVVYISDSQYFVGQLYSDLG